MQASLYLQTATISARSRHECLPWARSGHHYHHCQVSLKFSPLLTNGLRAGPGLKTMNPAACAGMTPPRDETGKKKGEEARSRLAKSLAASVVLACALGAMCTSWKANANPNFWPFSPIKPPYSETQSSTKTREPTLLEMSKQVLKEMFESKRKPAVPPKRVVEVHKGQITPGTKEWNSYLDMLEKHDKQTEAATVSLYDYWIQREESDRKSNRWDNDIYIVGLMLVDLLINQREYVRARHVIQKLERFEMVDYRYQIRKEILEKINGEPKRALDILEKFRPDGVQNIPNEEISSKGPGKGPKK